MRPWILLCGLTLLAISPALAGDGEKACDMKTVVKMRYCPADDVLLGKDEVVSNKVYYWCKECEETHDGAGKCPFCESELVKKTSGKDACPHCFGETEEVEACVKTYWACPDCDETAAGPGKCDSCETDRVEVKVPAMIVYVCEDCGATERKPGKCTTEDCGSKGDALVKTCSASGTTPHGSSD